MVDNVIALADDKERAITDHAILTHQAMDSGIVRPESQAPQFEFEPLMFVMLETIGHFNGLPNEDPHLHLRLFMEVSDAFKFSDATEDVLRRRLFPFSLRDRARSWFYSLPLDSITTWKDLVEKFLMEYFPPAKKAWLRNEIMSFHQLEDELLYEAWESFKELLMKCPHHDIPDWLQIERFYFGLNSSSWLMLDMSANGSLLSKSYNEAYDILERIARYGYRRPTSRLTSDERVACEAITTLTAKVESLANMITSLSIGSETSQNQAVIVSGMTRAPNHAAEVSCDYCGEDHLSDRCPGNPDSINYVENSYNPGWRKYPNFSWNNQGL